MYKNDRHRHWIITIWYKNQKAKLYYIDFYWRLFLGGNTLAEPQRWYTYEHFRLWTHGKAQPSKVVRKPKGKSRCPV